MAGFFWTCFFLRSDSSIINKALMSSRTRSSRKPLSPIIYVVAFLIYHLSSSSYLAFLCASPGVMWSNYHPNHDVVDLVYTERRIVLALLCCRALFCVSCVRLLRCPRLPSLLLSSAPFSCSSCSCSSRLTSCSSSFLGRFLRVFSFSFKLFSKNHINSTADSSTCDAGWCLFDVSRNHGMLVVIRRSSGEKYVLVYLTDHTNCKVTRESIPPVFE